MTIELREDALELDDIVVIRTVQGRWIGRALVAAVEARTLTERKPAVTLGTSRNATGPPWKAFDWWRHRGYGVVRETRSAWTASFGGSEIRMQKNLAQGTDS